MIEPYNIGGNVEPIRSLNPKMVMLTTASQAHGRNIGFSRNGSRGLILWDPKSEFVQSDGVIVRHGRDAELLFQGDPRGIGALVINSERQSDPIAIHYPKLPACARNGHRADRGATPGTKRLGPGLTQTVPCDGCASRNVGYLEDLVCRYTFVTSEQIERAICEEDTVLILPRSTAPRNPRRGRCKHSWSKGAC